FEKNNNVYELSFVSGNQQKLIDEFNLLLSTFKFTDQTDAIGTENWKTYTNTTYGFSIKYPKELNISDEKTVTDSIFSVIWNSSKTGFENASGMRISIYQRNGKTPNEWIIPNYSFVKNISVDGINGIIAHAIVVMNGDFNATVFQKGNYIYLIQTSSDLSDASKDPIDLLEQITSTFKFIPK
ncbi:MAG: PsbP-related protein, partial [Candidatus Staskawiczbacteria bacterium]|nr:PsbP-related protein [Candidatus Staskawiczbacteria bacterium]